MRLSLLADYLTLLLLVISNPKEEASRWSRGTAKKRARTEHLLANICLPPTFCDDCSESVPLRALQVPLIDIPSLDWSTLDPIFDPQQGGNLRADTPRAQRKRHQVEAFARILSALLLLANKSNTDEPLTIVDAGSGAGNLAISLAGLLAKQLPDRMNAITVCAVDVNPMALQRLTARAATLPVNDSIYVTTLCADLASVVLPADTAVVCSLHACGAATDLAIRLATQLQVPFVTSPCCTAKAVTSRLLLKNIHGRPMMESSSAQRSAAPDTITYPRSAWLRSNLQQLIDKEKDNMVDDNSNKNSQSPERYYEILARTADVGLGPQTPIEQRTHQRLAKYAVELDRLMGVQERHQYTTRIFKLNGHEDYGKSELMVGAPAGSAAAEAILNFDTTNSMLIG
jgi:hypothetical protein